MPHAKSSHLCPACQMPLSVEIQATNPITVYLVWCGYGPCENQTANNGACGQTEQEASQNLASLCDKQSEEE